MRSLLLAAALSFAATHAFAQDVANGEDVFKKCRACHAIGAGAKNLVGPQLNGLVGRKSGSSEGFPYSEANKNSGVTWDKETFLKYIKDPKGFMPGNKMAFAGVKDEQDAADLFAYISQFNADGSKK
ncbi:MAG: cytochrome c family protein [Hyphomicrobiales bacterium]|nr:MAG: cytochrome c family protein [Hyphomicrobiales bacterium]